MTDNWVLVNQINMVQWETNYSIYNPGTGETHLVNALPAEILMYLSRHEASSRDISQKIAELCGEELTSDLEDRVMLVLEQLKEIDLVELSH